jgi:hypothetical protein
MAQAVKPGSVKAPSGKSVPPPKGVQKSVPTGPPPGRPAPPPVAPGKGFGGKPAPKQFGSKK